MLVFSFPFFLSFFFFSIFILLNGWLTGCSSGEPHSWRVFVVEKTLYKKKKKNWHLLSQDDSYQKQKTKGKRSRVCFQDKVCFQNRKNPSWINNDTSIQPTESVKVKRFSCQKESCDPSHRFWCIPSYCGRTNCSLSRLFHPASPARLYYECTFIQPCLKSVTYRLMQHYLERSQSEMHAGKAGNHNLKQE